MDSLRMTADSGRYTDAETDIGSYIETGRTVVKGLILTARCYLYRGVSKSLHEKLNGQLLPKATSPFIYTFHLDEGFHLDSGATLDASQANTVIRHQLERAGFPTCGVSTTPHFDRARFYATSRNGDGFVYQIDRTLLREHGILEYVVAEYVRCPSVPDDDEVILVASDNGPIPHSVVAEIIPVAGS